MFNICVYFVHSKPFKIIKFVVPLVVEIKINVTKTLKL